MTDAMRRSVLIAGVVAVIVGVGLADAGRGGETTGSVGSPARGVFSASGVGVSRSDAESSAWFCAGGTGAGANAQAGLVLSNPAPRAITATVSTVSAGTVTPAVAGPQSMSVVVPAGRQINVVPAPGVSGGALASSVVFDGGGVGVSQVVTGPLGDSAAPCASTTAGNWYFADGSTTGTNTLSLSLFNPSQTTAVVDVSFVSSTNGLISPPAYQGIDVPGGSLVLENIGDHVRNVSDIATVVTTLSGAVVAAELESAGQPGNGGPSLTLGAVKPSSTWTFAQNMNVSGADTVFHLFNPTSRPARVTLKIGLQQGAAEPLVIRVPALSASVLDAASVTRIPANTAFSATFSSGRSAGIVVSRSLSSVAGAPAPQLGDVAGVPGGSDRWLLPAATLPITGVSALTIVDQNPAVVTVGLVAVTPKGLVPVAGFGHRQVHPGRPLIVNPATGSVIGTVPLEVVSSGPVAVEVDATPVGNQGVVVIPALSLP
ncbi:MAG TPA: hypothetical protein VNC61_14270 [Acidimicrobiales bacterium]|nr:hypothetical protein [Acidimicrobiales bacterium]